MPEQTHIPRILWAQQREHVLVTVAVPDIEKVDVKFEEDSVSFQGQTSNGKDPNVYAVKLDLYEKINPETSKYQNIGQKFWRLLLDKKEPKVTFWPRLTKEKTRLHWLQTDFDHWKDEDGSDDEKGGFSGNFQDMFSGGMGDMPDMNMNGGPDDEDSNDSDDEKSSPEIDANNEKEQESKKSIDEEVSTPTTTGEQ